MADARAPVRSWPNRPTAEPSPDVVIVGGGVIGCASAYHLSLAGVGVLLLERERLAAGASGVAAGMLAPQAEAAHDDAFFALALCGRAEHLPLATMLLDDVGLDVECRMTGILRGARFGEGTAVVALETAGERVSGVRTPTGVIAAGTVVLAAGVCSGDLARGAGLDLPIGPVKGQIVTLRSLAICPRHVIWARECYLAPKVDGQVVLGATEEDGNYDPRPTLAGVGALATAALEFLPAAGQLTVDGVWAGLRPAPPDRYPLVGRVPGLANLILATAHYRNGVLLGPLTGRWVAQMIEIGTTAPELAPFGPERLGPLARSALDAPPTPSHAP